MQSQLSQFEWIRCLGNLISIYRVISITNIIKITKKLRMIRSVQFISPIGVLFCYHPKNYKVLGYSKWLRKIIRLLVRLMFMHESLKVQKNLRTCVPPRRVCVLGLCTHAPTRNKHTNTQRRCACNVQCAIYMYMPTFCCVSVCLSQGKWLSRVHIAKIKINTQNYEFVRGCLQKCGNTRSEEIFTSLWPGHASTHCPRRG